jgi:type VI secretion system secreted protein Hcp
MALDAFLQFNNTGSDSAPEIRGETQDVVMSKLKPFPPFDLQGWSFGASQAVNVGSSSSGIATGKVEFQPFKITKQVDTCSPAFFKTCAQGGHFPECTLYVRKGGGAVAGSGMIYLRFDFKMVFVTEISWSHDETAPKEEITFDYGALQLSYTKQRSTGGPAKEITTGASSSPGGEATVSWSKLLNNNSFEVVNK